MCQAAWDDGGICLILPLPSFFPPTPHTHTAHTILELLLLSIGLPRSDRPSENQIPRRERKKEKEKSQRNPKGQLAALAAALAALALVWNALF